MPGEHVAGTHCNGDAQETLDDLLPGGTDLSHSYKSCVRPGFPHRTVG